MISSCFHVIVEVCIMYAKSEWNTIPRMICWYLIIFETIELSTVSEMKHRLERVIWYAFKDVTSCTDKKWLCSHNELISHSSSVGGKISKCIYILREFTSIVTENGKWGSWGPWSECSTKCGKGYQRRNRNCNNPSPLNGGNTCFGDAVQRVPCSSVCPSKWNGL